MSLHSTGLITHNVLIRKAYRNQLVLVSCHYLSYYNFPYWSSEGRSFGMQSLNPCPENFSQNVLDYPNLLKRGGGNLL